MAKTVDTIEQTVLFCSINGSPEDNQITLVNILRVLKDADLEARDNILNLLFSKIKINICMGGVVK